MSTFNPDRASRIARQQATGADCVAQVPVKAGGYAWITQILFSLSEAPLAGGVELKVEYGGNLIFTHRVTAAGIGSVPFFEPVDLPESENASTIDVTLASGGAGVVGDVTVFYAP